MSTARRRRRPFGGTIAHGYLSLSMLPMLLSEVLNVEGARMGINYGIDRVRFTAPVPSGSDVRLHTKLLSGEPRGGRAVQDRRRGRDQGSREARARGRSAVPVFT